MVCEVTSQVDGLSVFWLGGFGNVAAGTKPHRAVAWLKGRAYLSGMSTAGCCQTEVKEMAQKSRNAGVIPQGYQIDRNSGITWNRRFISVNCNGRGMHRSRLLLEPLLCFSAGPENNRRLGDFHSTGLKPPLHGPARSCRNGRYHGVASARAC
jgi:hypothetical protein